MSMVRLLETMREAQGVLLSYRDELLAAEDDDDDAAAEIVRVELVAAELQAVLEDGTGLVPDARRLREDREYIVELVRRTGLSTRKVAAAIGIDDGELRGYMSGRRPWPYPVQYALEQLARSVKNADQTDPEP